VSGVAQAWPADPSHSARRAAWPLRARVFAATWIAYAGFYLCRKNFGVAMPFLQSEAGISKMGLADILFAYSLCYALGQFLSGSLADRFSPRLIVTAGLCAAALANVAMFADPVFSVLLALGMINGLAQSCGWPGLLKIMAAWFTPAERGVVMGWWTTNYVLGGFLATVLAASLVSGGDWRRAFVVPGLLLLGVGAIFRLMALDGPSAAPVRDPATEARPFAAYLAVMRRPVAWATASAAFLVKITRYSFLFWLPLYFTEHLHYRPDQAGYLSSVYELAGVAGALLAGYASDKFLGSRRYPVVAMMLVLLAAACLMQPGLAATGWTGALGGVALIGMMTFGPDTLLQGAASQDAGGAGSAASSAGLVNGIASLGQLVSPYLVAGIATRWGWDTLFLCFVGVALAGAAVCALFWKHRAHESLD
jgi:OPA family sugar phosphate sensor protein UhpC-like MFS transporter